MAHNRPTLEQLAINFANTGTVSVALTPGVGGNTDIAFTATGGPQGATGIQGFVGTQGTYGTQGIIGNTGSQGAIGIQGLDGLYAGQGATGAQGTIGSQGVQGAAADGSLYVAKAGSTMTGALSHDFASNNNFMYGSANNKGNFALLLGAAYDGSITPQIRGWDYLAPGGEAGNLAFSSASSYSNSAIIFNTPKVVVTSNLWVSGVVDSGLTVSNQVRVQGLYPFVTYYQTDGAANQKYAIQLTDGSAWDFRLYDDTQTNYSSALLIVRDGWQPSGITMNGNVSIVATSGNEPTATFYRPSKPAGVGVGLLNWNGLNASDSPVTYARLQTEIAANTAGSHTGRFQIENSIAGTMTPVLTANGENVGIGIVSPDYKLVVSRDATTSLGIPHLELYSPDTGVSAANISLRFHQAERYYSTIRVNNQGFYFTGGADATPAWIERVGRVKLFEGQVWSETIPGTAIGSLHINPNGTTDHQGGAITFGASDSSSGTIAQAGIYTRTDGSYGTKMYFATSGDYGVGSVNRMSIIHNGNVGIGSAATVANPGSPVHVDDGAWSRLHLGYQGSTNYMDATNQNFRTYTGYQQLSLYSNNIVQHVGGLYKNDNYGFNGVACVMHPKGGSRSSGTNGETGYIRIKVPKSNNDTMFAFTVNIFDYQGGAEGYHRQVRVYGYAYGSGWANYGAHEIAGNGSIAPLEVRFGSDGTNNIIWLGTSGTVWYYSQISITDVLAGYYGIDTGWAYGWGVSIDATLGGAVAAGPIYTGKAIVSNYENSAWMEPNPTSSYGAWRIAGSKGGYGGIFDDYSDVHWMNDAAGNGGFYLNAGVWSQYWNAGHACLAIGASSTSSSYKLYVHGAIYATSDIVAYSDARKKENVYTIENPLAKVCALRGVNFNRIDDPDKKLQMGVIAQEVLEVIPEVVTHAETRDADENETEEYGVNYGALVGVLIEAIKELNTKVDAQAKLIEELRNG